MKETGENTESVGGQGETVDSHHQRQHLKMVERAIREEWNVSPELRPKLVPAAAEIAFNESEETRDRLAAFKVILAANAQNLKREELERAAEEPKHGDTINVYIDQRRTGLASLIDSLRDRARIEPDQIPVDREGPAAVGDVPG